LKQAAHRGADSAVRAPRLRRWAGALAVALAAAALNVLAWWLLNPPLAAPDAPQRIAGVAYNAFQRWDSPLDGRYPDDDAVAADLRQLATLTRRLRTYSATEFPALPTLAQAVGIELALGVWLDTREANNTRELAAGIAAARRHANVTQLIVGNETQLHHKLPPAQLYAHLARARALAGVPVSTAEPWHVWLAQPALASQVDFLTVHLLPYWEGVPVEQAVDEALGRLAWVRERFPGRRIVIGEVGWPAGGSSVGPAHATPERQAAFVRSFVARAESLGLDYYLMEAVDQPWKRATEGAVGAHWGLLDAQRRAKFAFTGPLHADPHWRAKALSAGGLGLLLALPFLLAFARLRLAGRLCFALGLQAVSSMAVLLAVLPLQHYLRPLDVMLLALVVPALGVMAAILLTQGFEFAELFWPGSLQRELGPRQQAPGRALPPISIHLACCNEPPQTVIATLQGLLALRAPALEVLVVDNNTTDRNLWRPVRAFVLQHRRAARRRGETPRLRFFHLPRWPGYKAGALNFALEQTDARAQWVGVVDADYVVQPQWLQQLGGYLDDPAVAAVQAPQAHRGWAGRTLARMMNWEYEGFFRIGMHHRHERDAIVQHGTMTLIRADALRRAGGWAEDCVCEDTELGLRLLAGGGRVVYVDRVLGSGLVPADFAAYRRQRHRWAEGAMQILRRHARLLLTGRRTGAAGAERLTLGQRYHFVAGWLPWVGDALHLVFSIAAMLWTLGLLLWPQAIGLPIALFVVPLAVFFSARLVAMPLLYLRRVRCAAADIAGAALAGMALSHVIARGVFAGLRGGRAVFEVTRKALPATTTAAAAAQAPAAASAAPPPRWAAVREEAVLLGGLVACAAAVVAMPGPLDGPRAGWLTVLLLQALPYVAALACAALSSRPDAPAPVDRRAGSPVPGGDATPQPAAAAAQRTLASTAQGQAR
jgi:exo-beta-1,3-glucanase (GH17 family)/cellulose synthase/poly-beta-1,6-N-acetylglucosamine synthase-like glycosyltransferase